MRPSVRPGGRPVVRSVVRPVSRPVGRPVAHPVARPCAYRAAYALLESRPQASAGQDLGVSPALMLGPGAFVSGLAALWPDAMLSWALGLISAYVLCVSAMRLAGAVLGPAWSARRALSRADLPSVSIIVALYREAKVAPGLAASLSRLDYPADRLQILFALEASDAETVTAVQSLARRTGITALVLPECGPRTKPRALNFALQAATGDLVAVYDAEDAPHPGQLRAAAEAFAADDALAVVQAPLNWYNHAQNWLTRQFALEYAAQFQALLPLYCRLGLPLPLGGTSNVFRRDRLEAAGAWDPFNVTEDADLGFRLARHGWKAGVIAPGTGEEAPVTRRAWSAQRSRWLKGHMVSWIVQMRDPAGLFAAAGWRALIGLQLTLLANALSAALHGPGLLLVAVSTAMLISGHGSAAGAAAILTALAAYLCAMACAAAGAVRAGLKPRAGDLLMMPAYWLLQGPALLRALREMITAPYFWAKTRHGVSTARREAPDEHGDDPCADGSGRQRLRTGRMAIRAPG